MDTEVQNVIKEARKKMNKAINHLSEKLARIRAGKANPRILDGVMVDYYGVQTPLYQIANIGTPDAKTITVQPWDKNAIDKVEKAIMDSDLGLNPANHGDIIRINIPPLTEERRKSLVKQVHSEAEDSRVSVRNARREANDKLKKMKNEGFPEDETTRAEEEVQKLTDESVKKVDEILEEKEKEIMTV
ncbi:MAG: ribosome recycling factor [Bacteroidales bacterium]|nr:ribosome recycling factor [Bacteroidales bacterium]